ncbi:hypothetical protein LZ32DRAFT_34351 [Colletotrichum eremochloae]|nr:hypothetical protein LZ32DRAFT_34351 [Colletotrichum eremochloae]
MLTDDDISDQDWGTVSATADKLYANNSPMSSKRSQSFGSGSLPSPPEPKRPRHDSTEPPDCNPLDDTKALTEKLISVETMSFEEMVSCIMTMGTQGVDQSLRGKKKKPAYYVVWVGRDWGIYTQWDECKSQVHEVKGGQRELPVGSYPSQWFSS